YLQRHKRPTWKLWPPALPEHLGKMRLRDDSRRSRGGSAAGCSWGSPRVAPSRGDSPAECRRLFVSLAEICSPVQEGCLLAPHRCLPKWLERSLGLERWGQQRQPLPV